MVLKRIIFTNWSYLRQYGDEMIKLKELLYLKSLKGVGKATIYKTYWDMLNDCDAFYDFVIDVEKTGKFSDDESRKAMNNAEKMYNDLINSEMEIITVFDENYPKKLEVMGNKRPLILYARGNLDALAKANIGIIGTRKPSKLSREFEQNMVKSIVNSTDMVVVSGLALGCDRIAHQATVDENKITVAVLPGDVYNIKPASHKKLAEDIIQAGGCLISEYEPGVSVQKGNYIDRDNVVAAFSDSIFVVECGIKSGTMHTLDFAEKYGRQIYSYLPDERPEGSYDGNEYILKNNKNALKVEDIEEFLDDLSSLKIKKSTKSVQQTLF